MPNIGVFSSVQFSSEQCVSLAQFTGDHSSGLMHWRYVPRPPTSNNEFLMGQHSWHASGVNQTHNTEQTLIIQNGKHIRRMFPIWLISKFEQEHPYHLPAFGVHMWRFPPSPCRRIYSLYPCVVSLFPVHHLRLAHISCLRRQHRCALIHLGTN